MQWPKKIELSVCSDCDFCKDVGTRKLNSHAAEAIFGCTNAELIRVTMPLYSFRVFGRNDEWVTFALLEKEGRFPIPHANCPFVKESV